MDQARSKKRKYSKLWVKNIIIFLHHWQLWVFFLFPYFSCTRFNPHRTGYQKIGRGTFRSAGPPWEESFFPASPNLSPSELHARTQTRTRTHPPTHAHYAALVEPLARPTALVAMALGPRAAARKLGACLGRGCLQWPALLPEDRRQLLAYFAGEAEYAAAEQEQLKRFPPWPWPEASPPPPHICAIHLFRFWRRGCSPHWPSPAKAAPPEGGAAGPASQPLFAKSSQKKKLSRCAKDVWETIMAPKKMVFLSVF